MENVYVGSTIRVTVDFQAWSVGVTPVLEDPVSTSVSVINSVGSILSTTTPSRLNVGVYYIDWTFTSADEFTIEFVGTFTDGDTSIITSHVNAIIPGSQADLTTTILPTLEEDQYLTFLVNVTPMFIDPEDVKPLFPEAALAEISELIYTFSQEALDIVLSKDVTGKVVEEPNVPPVFREFVYASTCCALSRIYDVGAGSNETAIALGDLSVTIRSDIKDKVNRTNATTWCELAAVIRDELYRHSSRSGIRQIVRGDKVNDSLPNRELMRAEWKGWVANQNFTRRGNRFGA